jgi:hypothetical protein
VYGRSFNKNTPPQAMGYFMPVDFTNANKSAFATQGEIALLPLGNPPLCKVPAASGGVIVNISLKQQQFNRHCELYTATGALIA